MRWDNDGADWPNRDHSQFVDSRPHRWHAQTMGLNGPVLLLLHGTGGATHSWRDLMPDLARDYRVVAPDLPGHGFTALGSRHRSSLPAMAEDTWHLCNTMGVQPDVIVGHSAGAAIAFAMAQSRPGPHIIGLNAALGAFEGPPAWLFPIMARALASFPLVPNLFSRIATSTGGVDRLLDATGSILDPTGRRLYSRLVGNPSHVEGALEMMARWSTRSVRDRIKTMETPATLIVGDRDGTVPPSVSRDIAAENPNVSYVSLGPYGHLAHEEAPAETADAIRSIIFASAPATER
ncbi:alpha/beta fold hydrolase BchO [Palleronia abyssalis]|uniref:Tropinesterase n=1 Tax=Palleronia abyssalis TaxID=1501240 RepID=A0A2R8BSJ0_9RHOB|nr:alpha/beta fold hydrolase BchO [Palleronia abyssalis]SPJ23122.1 Tropinesterase [Palleronia abyssalis]